MRSSNRLSWRRSSDPARPAGQVADGCLFEDEELAVDRNRRDLVASARATQPVRLEKHTHLTPDGLPVKSLQILAAHLATRCRNPRAERLAIPSR